MVEWYLERRNGNRKDAIHIEVGQIWSTKTFGDVKVISFEMEDNNKERVRIRFLNTGGVRLVEPSELKRGEFSDHELWNGSHKNKIISTQKYGYFRILTDPEEGVPSREKKVDIKFLSTGAVNKNVLLSHTLRGSAKDHYAPIVFGRGYLGRGKHEPMESCGRKKTRCYQLWIGVLKRTDVTRVRKNYQAYRDFNITVCEEWHNFQNFAEWYYNQPNSDKGWEFDKDMITHGSVVYSPDTCCFIPREINTFISFDHRKVGYERRGVYHSRGVWYAIIGNGSSSDSLTFGRMRSAKEAFVKYKEVKEQKAKELADKWDGQVDSRVIDSLRNLDIQPVWPD